VLVIGPVGTAVATGSTWALSSILFLFVLHRRLDLPAKASWRAAGTAFLAAAVAVAVYWTSSSLGIPQSRHDAFLSVVPLAVIGGLVYLGFSVSFRLLSLSDAYGGMRSVLRRAG
jgi:peptidoglycan biosynthesis protein MviN/MurJ (putative lipid II flippase)